MSVVLGVLIGVSVLIFVCMSIFSNVKTWTAIGSMFGSLRRLDPAERRRVLRQSAVMYVLVGGYFALLITHPLGLRDTFIWFLIVPFLTFAPLGVLAVGIHAWRRPRHESPASSPSSAGSAGDPASVARHRVGDEPTAE